MGMTRHTGHVRLGLVPAVAVMAALIALLASAAPAVADLKICNRMSYVVDADRAERQRRALRRGIG